MAQVLPSAEATVLPECAVPRGCAVCHSRPQTQVSSLCGCHVVGGLDHQKLLLYVWRQKPRYSDHWPPPGSLQGRGCSWLPAFRCRGHLKPKGAVSTCLALWPPPLHAPPSSLLCTGGTHPMTRATSPSQGPYSHSCWHRESMYTKLAIGYAVPLRLTPRLLLDLEVHGEVRWRRCLREAEPMRMDWSLRQQRPFPNKVALVCRSADTHRLSNEDMELFGITNSWDCAPKQKGPTVIHQVLRALCCSTPHHQSPESRVLLEGTRRPGLEGCRAVVGAAGEAAAPQ